jgi:hypothetical protein
MVTHIPSAENHTLAIFVRLPWVPLVLPRGELQLEYSERIFHGVSGRYCLNYPEAVEERGEAKFLTSRVFGRAKLFSGLRDTNIRS